MLIKHGAYSYYENAVHKFIDQSPLFIAIDQDDVVTLQAIYNNIILDDTTKSKQGHSPAVYACIQKSINCRNFII